MRAKCGTWLSHTPIVSSSLHLTSLHLHTRFGEDSVEKMVDWVSDNVPIAHEPTILEVGSGNGVLLFALHEIGYRAQLMCGVDYSKDAVKLSRAIAASRNGDAKHITFDICDFLRHYPPPLDGKPIGFDAAHATWDLVLDKGTFDAIALSERRSDGHIPANDYPPRIGEVVKPGGYFLIVCEFSPWATSGLRIVLIMSAGFCAQRAISLRRSSRRCSPRPRRGCNTSAYTIPILFALFVCSLRKVLNPNDAPH